MGKYIENIAWRIKNYRYVWDVSRIKSDDDCKRVFRPSGTFSCGDATISFTRWYQVYGDTLAASEHAVYRRGTGDNLLLVGVYVDDLVITGVGLKEIDLFKQQMTELFRMSDLGKLSRSEERRVGKEC